MFKTITFAVLAIFSSIVLAVGPSQQWRIDITGSESGNVEVAEIELREISGGNSVVDLFRNYTFEVTDPAGLATWSIPHNLGIQRNTMSVDVIAYAVDVVAPGDWFYNPNTYTLYKRTNLSYESVEYALGPTGGEPTTPEVGDIFYDTLLLVFSQWDGAVWQSLTVTSTINALPIPNSVIADSIIYVLGTGLPATGGPSANNTVEITFPEVVVGAATIHGASFDMASTNRSGSAIPVIEGLENRPASAAFDGNKGSWFKSSRAPSENSPLSLQYTYWVGDPSRYPNVVEYTITAITKDSAPKSWKLQMYKDGQWITVDQKSAIRFENGETKVFTIQ